MTVLVVGGVMDLLIMADVTAAINDERLLPLASRSHAPPGALSSAPGCP